MFDYATIQYRPDMHDGARYDVKLYSLVDGKLWYAGNGRYCPTSDDAQAFAHANAATVEIIPPAIYR